MKTKNKNLTTLEEFKEKNYGKRGTKKRDELEAGYEIFKMGALIHDTRLEMGMTQEQLAEKVGTTKSYISKIENNIKEARISTLQKIVELRFWRTFRIINKNLIDKKVKRSADELKEIVIGILDGLQYLHTPNAMHQKPAIIHRDLKASNILFTTIGGKLIPKICDFGISKEIGSLGATTATGTGYLGTIEYMAPEQINLAKFGKDGKLQPNTDLWALGCMLYEYFTGKAPFGKRTDGDMQIDIQNKILDNEPSYPASIPLNYKEIIQKCLVKNAADRVQDATTLKGILLGNGEIKKIDSEISIAKAPIKIKKDWEVIPIGGNGEYIDGNISKEKKKEDNEYGEVFLGISFGVVALVMVAILYFANKKNEKNDISYDVATEEVVVEYEVVDTFAMGGVHEFEFTNSLNEKFSYNGEFISGENGSDDYIPQGKGIAIYTNGEEYEGDFVNGIREGDGIYYWKEGEKYIGKYKNNKRNGYGKYYDANGNIIEQGFYVNGVLQ
jgi:serine/threonine protein kinase